MIRSFSINILGMAGLQKKHSGESNM